MKIYLDNNATTMVPPAVVDAMLPFFFDSYENASSICGMNAHVDAPIREAKAALAALCGSSEPECFFLTSGATEANNWAVIASTHARRDGARVITTAIEHPSVLEPISYLKSSGIDVVVSPVLSSGVIDCENLIQSVTPRTCLVSVMAANNETGVIQPVGLLARRVKEIAPDCIFHTDATQVVGKIPMSLDEDMDCVDLLSLSAHKFHGPKGIGALFARDPSRLPSLLRGGGQQNDKRSGTLNTPGAAGLAAAARLAIVAISADAVSQMRVLRDSLETTMFARLPGLSFIGADVARLPNTSQFLLPGVDAAAVVYALAQRGICVATGSACSAGAESPSHVLLAMGVPHEKAWSAMRVSLSRFETKQHLDIFADACVTAVTDASAVFDPE